MQRHTLIKMFFAGAAALWLAISTPVFGQGVTSSGLNGLVTDKTGKPLAGVTITIVNEPSGTRDVTTTRSNGQYNISGLRVGGPYSVTASAKDLQPDTQHDIYLNLAETQDVSFQLSSDVVVMSAVEVTGARDITFTSAKMGASTVLNSAEIGDVPTVRRDVQDLVALDSRIGRAENTSTGEFGISAQGQNSRFNSFLIDGIQSNDPFGLNANGFSSLRSPIPLGTLAALTVDLSPYDVTRTAFTGALINAVTKSGTNEFHGQAYTYYTGKSFRGPNPGTGPLDPNKGKHDALQEHTNGFNFGGPILPDKLFFFVAYEDYRKTLAAPGQTFVPDASVIAQVAAAATAYGYQPGVIAANSSVSTQKTYLAKIDWNITTDQRGTFTYRRTDSATPTFADFNGSTYTSFSNHWYESRRITDNYNVQLNSQWNSDFRTDASVAYVKYNGTAGPNGTPFPEIYVNGVTGIRTDTGAVVTNGQIDLGTNYSYQLNSLFTKDYNGHLYGEYSWGDHTFKFGGDTDKSQYDDRFLQYYYGRFAYASPAAFAAGTANYLRYQSASPGYTIPQGFAEYSLTDYGLLAQDTWKPNANLTVNGGLRFDYPWIPNKPPFNPSFFNAFGYSNNITGSGNYVLAPRVGFSYNLPLKRKTQIRGGLGLFQGTNPAVWVANAFQTAGAANAVQLGSSTTSTTAATVITVPPGTLNAGYVQTLPPPGVPTPAIDTIDPHYRTPSSWKGNLAVDHTLPWFDLIATAEVNLLQVEKAIYLQSMNINPVGTEPDGRIRYSGSLHSNFGAVINMSNTSEGGSQAYTLALRRPMKNNWSFSAAYTRTHATEVQPLTSSVATSSYNYRSTFNPNENVARTSSYVVPDSWVFTATRKFNFFGRSDASTRISAIFRAQTGHAYSWVFSGDANGDGISGNDSFYVPSGPNDPKVTWADATQQANFFNFVANTDLRKYMGQVVPANSSFNPWQKTLDVHLEQEIPIYRKARLSVFFDCLNFANLFNKNWGVVNGLDFGNSYSGYNRSVASATYNAATNQYAYTFTSSTLGGQITFTDLSRWQLQIGAKLEF
jgi:Carboxypeptidase regulatory-like domain